MHIVHERVGWLFWQAMTKSFDSRKIATYMERITSLEKILAFQQVSMSEYLASISELPATCVLQLSTLLKDSLEDEASTAYISHHDKGWLWRQLGMIHPTLIDFMLDKDEQKVAHFNINPHLCCLAADWLMQVQSFLSALDHFFINHYVAPGEGEGNEKLYMLVRKRDRPSVLAWLAKCTLQQRNLFREMVQELQMANTQIEIEHTAGRQALQVGGEIIDSIIYQVWAV